MDISCIFYALKDAHLTSVTIWMVLHMGSVGTRISGDYRRKMIVGEMTIGECDCICE